MIELLTLGGIVTGLTAWGFWIGTLIVFGVLIGLAENEHYGWATAIFIGTFVTLSFMGAFNLYEFVLYHPGKLIYYASLYVLAGAAWGAIKWYLYCKKKRARYDVAKNEFLRSRKATELTGVLRLEWTEKLRNLDRYDRDRGISIEPPSASKNKEKIMNWMYLWPFSIFGTFFSDFIIKLWDNIYKWMGGIYDNISKSVWRGTENDLASEEDIESARQAAAALQNTPLPKSHSATRGNSSW